MGHESLTSPPINHSRRLGRPLLTVHRLLWLPQHTRVPLRSPRFHPGGNCHPDPLLLPAEQVPLPPARAARVAGQPRDGSQARGHGNAAHTAVVSRERVRGQRSVRRSEGCLGVEEQHGMSWADEREKSARCATRSRWTQAVSDIRVLQGDATACVRYGAFISMETEQGDGTTRGRTMTDALCPLRRSCSQPTHASRGHLHHPSLLPAIHRPLAHVVLVIIRRGVPHHPLPERDVDPPVRMLPLRHRMLPPMLRLASHDHHVPVVQHELLRGYAVGLVVHVPEVEVSWRAEGERGDARVGTEEGLAVGMVRDGVGSGRVVIDQSEVVGLPGDLFD